MSTLEMERGGDVVLHTETQAAPDHVPADVAAEHPDAASVVARRSGRPVTVRAVERPQRRSRAGLVLALAACACVAAFVGGGDGNSPETVRVSATTPAAATTVTSAAPHAQCPPGSPIVLRCEAPCTPAPFSPFGLCPPSAPSE